MVIGGLKQNSHCFVNDLPHSDGCFVKAYPAETTKCGCRSDLPVRMGLR